MNFKELLRKLEYSKSFNRSALIKEIVLNISHVDKAALLDILELLHHTENMDYKMKLISILTAYLHLNNSHRDIIIKSTPLYDSLSVILARGLPLKIAITLNFLTSLLYAEEEGASRSRTLTMHAQYLIRNSGCLTTITHLFTNYMLPVDSWQALCRCLAEVCRGSEPNQNFCSHLVPLCVMRCLQGNTEVLTILQSLLYNNKRNTLLFMESDGPSIFNRINYLRSEACLLLLNTIIQNSEVEIIRTMVTNYRLRENLQDLLKIYSHNLSIVQWITIILYYLDSKLRNNDNCYVSKTIKLNRTIEHMDDNVNNNINDTQILLQNIMAEVLSYPSKTLVHDSVKSIRRVPEKMSNVFDMSPVSDKKLYNVNTFERTQIPPLNINTTSSNKLSFSFLMEESLKLDQSHFNNKNSIYHKRKPNQSIINSKSITQSTETREHTKLNDTFNTFNGKCEDIKEFKPLFVSTPKSLTPKRISVIKSKSDKKSFKELHNKYRIRDRAIIKQGIKKTVSQEHTIKQRSMSSRLFDAINESCITVLKSVKNVFTGKSSITPRRDTENAIKNEGQTSHCSFTFTNYMRRRETELLERNSNKDFTSEINNTNVCDTCNNTFLLRHKFATDEQLKSTVKKLKLGINMYGCDFKRISKTMWPREPYMTPNVLYNLYRKLLSK